MGHVPAINPRATNNVCMRQEERRDLILILEMARGRQMLINPKKRLENLLAMAIPEIVDIAGRKNHEFVFRKETKIFNHTAMMKNDSVSGEIEELKKGKAENPKRLNQANIMTDLLRKNR